MLLLIQVIQQYYMILPQLHCVYNSFPAITLSWTPSVLISVVFGDAALHPSALSAWQSTQTRPQKCLFSMMDEPEGHNSRTTSWRSHTQPVCLCGWQRGEPREVLNHGHSSPIRKAALHAAGMEGVHWQVHASEQSPEVWMGWIPAAFLRRWGLFSAEDTNET